MGGWLGVLMERIDEDAPCRFDEVGNFWRAEHARWSRWT